MTDKDIDLMRERYQKAKLNYKKELSEFYKYVKFLFFVEKWQQKDIAKMLQISKQRVSQIVNK